MAHMGRAGRHLMSAWRSVQVLSAASPCACSAAASAAVSSRAARAGSVASSAFNSRQPMMSMMASMAAASTQHGSAASLGGGLPRMPFGLRQSSVLPAPLVSDGCASVCTSAAAGAASGLGPAAGEEGEDEATPHLRGGDTALQRRAKMAMGDPMSRLLASRGMPLGFSVEQMGKPSDTAAPPDGKPVPEPGYQMEALDEIFQTTRQQKGTEGEDSSHLDSWGTTRENPEEIARRLVESNRELDAMELPEAENVDEDDGLALAPGEAKYRTLEQMSKDIKGLDEVFDVLASVPWLDDSNVQQKELKGVAMVGLLGTLEEVGFNIRAQVLRIWAGERDHSLITECSEAKDQAALISILFHTKRLEEEHGAPEPCIVKF